MASGGPDMDRAGAAHRRGPAAVRLLIRAAFCLLVLGLGRWFLLSPEPVHPVTLEAGEPLEAGLFLAGEAEGASFASDMEDIDTAVPGKYAVSVVCGGRTYRTTLTVADTVPPAAVGRPAVAAYGTSLPASDCVQDVQDVTQVTAAWKKAPDLEKTDEPQDVVVRLTDAGGNHTDIQTQVTVRYDAQAPVILGTKDIQAFLGESIAYKDGVTVTDDTDQAPALTVDTDGVNINAAGTYTVTYTATDAAGNSTSTSVAVTLREKPAGYVDEQTVYKAAQPYYDQIIDEDMTDMEKTFMIYRWVRSYIDYRDNSNYEYWTMAAYQAFTELGGDCYNYFAAAKALLNMAGIENIEVDKSDTSRSRHYWLLVNLGYGWYHLDPTPRLGNAPDHTFMLTDAELDEYSLNHGGSNVYDPSLYPERATRSVQEYVDYENHVVHDPGW